MFWISRLNGVIWNICHSSNCIRQPTVRCPSSVMVNNRFRSADYLPCQLPLGGSQGEETMRFYHATNCSISCAAGGFYPPLRVRWKPYAYSNQRSTLPQLRIRSAAPSEREPRALRASGRVREPMYWYKPCASLAGGTAARADSIRPYRWLLPFIQPLSPVSCGHL